jgi:hypothetical protein
MDRDDTSGQISIRYLPEAGISKDLTQAILIGKRPDRSRQILRHACFIPRHSRADPWKQLE